MIGIGNGTGHGGSGDAFRQLLCTITLADMLLTKHQIGNHRGAVAASVGGTCPVREEVVDS